MANPATAMSLCLYCHEREAGDGRNVHQLCTHCRVIPAARRKFPPKAGGARPGQSTNPHQTRNRYGRFYCGGDRQGIRIDYPDGD